MSSVPSGSAVLCSPADKQLTLDSRRPDSSLTQHHVYVARLYAVGCSQDVSVRDQSPATRDEVPTGNIPDQHQGHPGELVRESLLPPVDPDVEVVGLFLHSALAVEGGQGTDEGEEEQQRCHPSPRRVEQKLS